MDKKGLMKQFQKEHSLVSLYDLPEDKVYVKLKEPFRQEIFKLLNDTFRQNNLKIEKSYIYNWKHGIRFCPLKTINKFISLLDNKNQSKIHELIENNIEAIKTQSKGTAIINTKFPIPLSSELIRIAGHLIGDGGISSHRKNMYRAYYSNKCDDLINEFIGDIKTVFGNVDIKIHIDKIFQVRKIKLPRIIGIILVQFFGLQSNEEKHVPKYIINANNHDKSIFLRALFDDEGCVDKRGRKMAFGMTRKEVVEYVKNTLLNDFGIKTGNIRTIERGGNRKLNYVFEITDHINFVAFHEKIGFTHPDKDYKIKYLIENYRPYFRKGEIDKIIIDIIEKNNNITAFEISNHINRCLGRTKQVLQKLEKEKYIKSGILKENLKMYSIG